MNRIYLNANGISSDFLKSNGAEFDRVIRQWFVHDVVPDELLNFLPETPSPRIDMRGISPLCPICGADMEVKENKKKNLEFWGCLNYRVTSCAGTYDYDDGLLSINARLDDIKRKLANSDKRKLDFLEIKSLINQNISLAKRAFNNDEELIIFWLNRPNKNLDGESPYSSMETVEGNAKVKSLLQMILDKK